MEDGISIRPAPRVNPEGRADGAWCVMLNGRILAWWAVDGRDKAERYIVDRERRRLESVRLGK